MKANRTQKINNFIEFQNRLFPDGNIPTREKITQLVLNGDTSIKTHILNKMYRDGVPTDPFLLADEKTKDFANKFNEAFGSTKQTSKNITGVVEDVNKIFSKGLTLEDDFESIYDKKVFSGSDTKALVNSYESTVKTREIPIPTIKGSKKLASGVVPKGLLKTVLEAVGSIPDEALRDATIASLIGYRGTDLTGALTNEVNPQSGKVIAAEEYPVRPYYDPETKSLSVPDVDVGAGRKGKDPLKQLGPLMQSIFDRRFANAVNGELFPNIETKHISEALNKYVFPKIPKEVLAHLKNKPKGYSAMRKIFASAIANDLGKPEIAAQLMGHGTGKLGETSVLNKFYATIVDEGGLQARTDTLLQLEKHMANALGVTTSGELATRLNLKLDNPDLNMVYPEFDMDKPIDSPEGQKIELSEEELELQKQQRLQAGEKNLAVDADITAQKQASAAEKIIANEDKLLKAEEIKENVRQTAKNIRTQKKIDEKNLKKQEVAKTLDELTNEFGVRDSTKPKGGLSKKLGVATAIAVGATGVAKASPFLPVVTAPFMADEAGNLIADKLTEFGVVESPDVIPEMAQDTAGFISELAPITPTDLKTASDVASFLAEKPAQAASEWEQGFLGAIKSQIR